MYTLTSIVNNKDLLDFSQHFSVVRNYVGSRLFPDQKTQHIEQEYTRLTENGNLPMVAKVHAFDTEAAIGSRAPIETVSLEELLIKEKINLSEKAQRLTRGLGMDQDALRRYVFDDVARMAESVVTRVELAKMDALSSGKMVINENGLDFVVDYEVPEDNFVSSDWTDGDADIIGDVTKWRLIATSKGYAPDIAITTEKVLMDIRQNVGIQKAIFGTSGVGRLPTPQEVSDLFAAMFGITVTVDEEKYGDMTTDTSGDPKIEQKRFFPEGRFVMTATTANGSVGAGLWGVTPEELEQGGAFDTKRQNQYVTVVSWNTPDPVATWTKASGLFVPVLPNVYSHIIADVTAIPDDDQSNDDSDDKTDNKPADNKDSEG